MKLVTTVSKGRYSNEQTVATASSLLVVQTVEVAAESDRLLVVAAVEDLLAESEQREYSE